MREDEKRLVYDLKLWVEGEQKKGRSKVVMKTSERKSLPDLTDFVLDLALFKEMVEQVVRGFDGEVAQGFMDVKLREVLEKELPFIQAMAKRRDVDESVSRIIKALARKQG